MFYVEFLRFEAKVTELRKKERVAQVKGVCSAVKSEDELTTSIAQLVEPVDYFELNIGLFV